MTAKDYKIIARVIKLTYESSIEDNSPNALWLKTLRSITNNLIIAFLTDNPRFNRGKFLKEAGI